MKPLNPSVSELVVRDEKFSKTTTEHTNMVKSHANRVLTDDQWIEQYGNEYEK